MNPGPVAYINGRFVPFSEAAIGLSDVGFVQGTTVAEQVRTFGGKLLWLDRHLKRLARGLAIVGIELGGRWDELPGIAAELVARNHALLSPGDDLGLAILVTPGAYSPLAEGADHGPTLILHTYPLPFRLWASKYGNGERLVVTDVRQVPGECWPPELKCRSRMHYYLADRQAASIEPGARALLLDTQGLITETSTANIAIYRSGEGFLVPPRTKVLPGISQGIVRELAESIGVGFHEEELWPCDVAAADEVILTSTPYLFMPVTRFQGHAVGSGAPGPMTAELLRLAREQTGVDLVAQARQFARRA